MWIRGVAAIITAMLALPTAAGAQIYGEWSLDQTKDTFIFLSWQSEFANEGGLTFSCHKSDSPVKISVTIFPPTDLYVNQSDVVRVMIEPNREPLEPLFQSWGNGYKYLFQNDAAMIEEISALFLQLPAATTVHLIFSGDFYGDPDRRALSIDVPLDGFQTGHNEWQRRCSALLR